MNLTLAEKLKGNMNPHNMELYHRSISSVKSKKGVNDLDVPLRTRRVLLLTYKVYGDSAILVLNSTSLNSVNALLALSRTICDFEFDESFSANLIPSCASTFL